MAPKTIRGWSRTDETRPDGETVWNLDAKGKRRIHLRFQNGMTDEQMEARAALAIANAEGDGDAIAEAHEAQKVADTVARRRAEQEA